MPKSVNWGETTHAAALPSDLKKKSKRKFTALIERDEAGNHLASFPGLHGCHTCAKSLDTLMKRAREVVELYLECGEEIDESLEFVGIQQISV
ncbi:MAG: type II toxin-antitoxin system HicB family antitoxin [Candidatus Acidiferrales bacterium]